MSLVRHWNPTAHAAELEEISKTIGQKYFPGKVAIGRGSRWGYAAGAAVEYLVNASRAKRRLSGGR